MVPQAGIGRREQELCPLMDVSALTLAEIKRRLECEPGTELEPEFLEALRQDHRAGVRELYRRIIERRKRAAAELARMRAMYRREDALAERGVTPVAGLDEVGRGPIAGPVVAAAVILPPGTLIRGLNDSKKITPARRLRIAEEITRTASDWSVALASVEEIERFNILGATFLAMRRAISLLHTRPAWLLVDGHMAVPGISIRQSAVVHGDAECASIAAASILAKVWRDELMTRCHRCFPEYGFAENKGYGTARHYECLQRFGPTPIHRRWGLKP